MRSFLLLLILMGSGVALGGEPYWLPVPSPTTQDLRSLMFTDSLHGWIAGNGGTLLRTSDGGESWAPLPSGITHDIVSVFMLNQTSGWALAIDVSGPIIYTLLLFTTDGGDSWRTEYYPVPDAVLNSILFVDPEKGWVAGENSELAGSPDGGRSWFDVSPDSGVPPPGDLRKLRFLTPNYGYATGGRFDLTGNIWRTTNGGASWSARLAAPEPVNDVHFIDSANVIGVTGDYDYGSGIVRTTDGGASWTYTYLGIWGDARGISFRTPAEGWVVLGFAGAVMVTRDTGSTWQSMFAPETTSVSAIQFTTPRRGFMIGAGGKIFRFDPDAVSVRESEPVPLRYRLYAPYPNPFNGSTVIGFELGDRTRTELSITDLLGRRVATLVDDVLEPGEHRAVLDAAGMASGVYFVRLRLQNQARAYTATAKLLLLR